jgi:hypothetical protein
LTWTVVDIIDDTKGVIRRRASYMVHLASGFDKQNILVVA